MIFILFKEKFCLYEIASFEILKIKSNFTLEESNHSHK